MQNSIGCWGRNWGRNSRKKFPFDAVQEQWIALIRSVARRGGLTTDEIGLYLFSQRNLHEIEETMEMLQQPMSKTHWIMDKWGYIGAASIPAALDDLIENGRNPKPGEPVIFCASGAGMALSCSLWKW